MRRLLTFLLSVFFMQSARAITMPSSALPETIPLDTNLSNLIRISPSWLPVVDPSSPAILLASYVTNPASSANSVAQAGLAAQTAVYPTSELNNRIQMNGCGASSCGAAPGLFPSVEIHSEFNRGSYPSPGPISSGSYPADTYSGGSVGGSGGGSESQSAMYEYNSAQSELSSAAQDLSNANSDLGQARSAYESAARSLGNELSELNQEASRLNEAIRARNAAASARNAAASQANAAKQALHNAVTENNRIIQDISNQTVNKANLEARLGDLEVEVKSRSQELASSIRDLSTVEQANTQLREGNKGTENQAIDDHNQFTGTINDNSRLAEGLDSIKDFLSESNRANESDGRTVLPSAPGDSGYIAPVTSSDNAIPPGINSRPGDRVSTRCGSIVRVDSLAVGESIPIVGVPFQLLYFTDRSSGRLGDYQIHLPLYEPSDGAVTNVKLDFSIAGRSMSRTFGGDQRFFDFVWDGRDKSGKAVLAKAPYEATLTIQKPGSTVTRKVSSFAGNFKPDYLGLGGWSVSIIHFFSTAESRIYFGTGATRQVSGKRLGNGNFLVPSEDGSEVYLFNSQGLHLETRHGLTGARLFLFSYNEEKRLESIEDAFKNKTTFSKSASTIVVKGPFGSETTLNLDDSDRLIRVSNPLGEAYQMKYSPQGLIAGFTKPSGGTSRFHYNDLGYLLRDEGPDGASVSFDGVLSSSIAGALDIETSTSEGRVSSYTISQGENGSYRRTISYPDGTTVQTNYQPSIFEQTTSKNESMNTSFSKDVRFGNDVSFVSSSRYSVPGLASSIDTQVSQTVVTGRTSRDFAEFRSLRTNITTNSKITQVEYLQNTRDTVIKSPAGRKLTMRMTPEGKPLLIQRGNSQPTKYLYDDLGRLTTIERGVRKTSFQYSQQGTVASLTDALGRVHGYAYDSAGRLTAKTLPDGKAIAYRYDPNGNLIGITPPDRLIYSFGFSLSDEMTSFAPPKLPALAKTETNYIYNRDKQLTAVNFPSGRTIQMIYGKNDGLLKTVSSGNGAYTYEYDVGSSPVKLTSPDGVVMDFQYFGHLPGVQTTRLPSGQTSSVAIQYNSDLFPASVSVAAGNTVHSVAYTYDPDGLLASVGEEVLDIEAQSGMVNQVRLGKISESYAADNNFDEYNSMTVNFSSTKELYSESLKRDNLGRIVGRSETIDGIPTNYEYEFDSAGQLVGVTEDGQAVSHYIYDSNGNRISAKIAAREFTASYDDQDRVIAYEFNKYGYGADGDLEWKENINTREIENYYYDTFGNLKKVKKASGPTIEYTIDGLNRRVAKKLDGRIEEQYVYHSSFQIAAILNREGHVVSRFFYGTKANSPDYMIKDGHRYKIVSDHLGSPRMVVNSESGEIVQRIHYDEFGRILDDSQPGFQPFGFAGGLYDRDTGLTRFGARDYDPETGRFLTKDPLGLHEGGDLNPYRYVMNDPVNLIDPAGESPLVVGAMIGALIGTYLTPVPIDTPTTPIGEAGRMVVGATAGAVVGGAIGVTSAVVAAPNANPYLRIGEGKFPEPYSQRISIGNTPGKKFEIGISPAGRIDVKFGPLRTTIRPGEKNACD